MDISSDISHNSTETRLKKASIKSETESLLIEGQNNGIRTEYINTRIDKTQQNSKSRLGVDKTKQLIT